jgi:hypothetical protein
MDWIAPAERDTAAGFLERQLWEAVVLFCAIPVILSQRSSNQMSFHKETVPNAA